jgi:hypothetical protein
MHPCSTLDLFLEVPLASPLGTIVDWYSTRRKEIDRGISSVIHDIGSKCRSTVRRLYYHTRNTQRKINFWSHTEDDNVTMIQRGPSPLEHT